MRKILMRCKLKIYTEISSPYYMKGKFQSHQKSLIKFFNVSQVIPRSTQLKSTNFFVCHTRWNFYEWKTLVREKREKSHHMAHAEREFSHIFRWIFHSFLHMRNFLLIFSCSTTLKRWWTIGNLRKELGKCF